MYKPEIIRINISSTFLIRARCKECGKGPDYYYAIMLPFKWKNIRNLLSVSKFARGWITRLVGTWYLNFDPRHFEKLGDFTFALEDKSYLPTFHRIRGAAMTERENMVEFLGCECGATVWAFNNKSTKNRPEITNRKGRYKYPQRFVY